MAMVPALQFTNWQWLSLVLAAPVVVWGGWPFHRAAWANLRHGAATMDTLISVGTLAAFGWSLWALFFGDGRHARHDACRSRSRSSAATGRRASTWRSPPGVTVVHPGRPLPRGRAKRRAGCRAAGAARAGRQGRRGAARRRASVRIPIEPARGRRPVRRASRREGRHRRRRRGGHARRSTPRC